MQMKPINSSNISAIGHNPYTNTMRVQFANGNTYAYHDVPRDVHEALVNADSVGSHFSQNIRNAYKYTKV